MNGTDWLVIAGGIAFIAWVNWYFFLAQRSAIATLPGTDAVVGGDEGARAGGSGGMPEVAVVVKGGYDPAIIRVTAGVPVRLVFDRQETSSCSEEVVFPDFGIKRFLPAFQKTVVEVTPPAPGKYGFTCGMSMLHGSIVAE